MVRDFFDLEGGCCARGAGGADPPGPFKAILVPWSDFIPPGLCELRTKVPEDRLRYVYMLCHMLNTLVRCARPSCPTSHNLFGVVLSQGAGGGGLCLISISGMQVGEMRQDMEPPVIVHRVFCFTLLFVCVLQSNLTGSWSSEWIAI